MPLQELKDMFNLVKRNLDVNLEQKASLESFNDFISILSAKRLAETPDSQLEDKADDSAAVPDTTLTHQPKSDEAAAASNGANQEQI